MNILDELELGTLKGMAIYWREAFNREDAARGPIMKAELAGVIGLIKPEKVLRIINAYVENLSDKEAT